MSTVWQFSYLDGESWESIVFDRAECERRATKKRCAVDIQRYRNGLARIYSGPDEWESYSLRFRILGEQTLTKIEQLFDIGAAIKHYYRKHIDNSFVWIKVVPELTERFTAGGLSVQSMEVAAIETNDPTA
jgi:hypothetical protein